MNTLRPMLNRILGVASLAAAGAMLFASDAVAHTLCFGALKTWTDSSSCSNAVSPIVTGVSFGGPGAKLSAWQNPANSQRYTFAHGFDGGTFFCERYTQGDTVGSNCAFAGTHHRVAVCDHSWGCGFE
jgi:hypothetical protein